MIERIIGVATGVFLLLLVLMARGIPVLFFLRILPLVLVLFIAFALIYAGITSD